MSAVVRRLALIGLLLAACHTASAQQPDPPAQVAGDYTSATRYNFGGLVTGTIAPDPDGAGQLKFAATRNTYGDPGTATSGMLVKVETGQLATWQDQYTEPNQWIGFTVYQTKLIAYDERARKVRETLLGQNGQAESVVQYSYDSHERLQCKAVRMHKGAFGSLPSDACQLGPQGTEGPDRITRFTYDALDQVLTEERAVGTSLAQTYVTNVYGVTNPSGLTATRLLKYQTDANGNRTELQYDDNLRLKRRIYPSPTTPGAVNIVDFNEYGYDKNGNVTFERKRSGQTVSNSFDDNNRLVYKDLSDNTHSDDISYRYDLRGLTLASCFDEDGNDEDDPGDDQCSTGGTGETNEFDGFGNLTVRGTRVGGIYRALTYAYDLEGNRTRVTHPDGWFFQYGFDGRNRMNSLGDSMSASPSAGVNPLLTITYAPSGGRASITRTSGAVTSVLPDNALRLDSFTQNFAGTSNDLTNGFGYNAASQVTTLTQSNTQYNYTAAQNRTGLYARNGLNQYTQIDGETLGYDANGNLQQDRDADGNLIDYTYDMENRLVQVEGPTQAALEYDPLGRLSRLTISGNVTQFLYDGDALVAEYLNGALTRRYVHGDQVDEPLVLYTNGVISTATRRFLHSDHQGSVIAWSDSSAAAVQKNAYDPYGIPAPGNSGRFGYTGQTWIPELGLNYYKARIYSPTLGRFLQTDPIFYKDDFNLYAYAYNDPISKRDPTGMKGAWCYSCMTQHVNSALKAGQIAMTAGVSHAERKIENGPANQRGANLASGIMYEKAASSLAKASDAVTYGTAAVQAVSGDIEGAVTTVGGDLIDKAIGAGVGAAVSFVATPAIGVPVGIATDAVMGEIGVGQSVAGPAVNAAATAINESVDSAINEVGQQAGAYVEGIKRDMDNLKCGGDPSCLK